MITIIMNIYNCHKGSHRNAKNTISCCDIFIFMTHFLSDVCYIGVELYCYLDSLL